MTSNLCQNPEVMVGRVAGTAVLFNLEDRQLHSLNETAARCWDLLDGEPAIDQLIASVSHLYGRETSQIGPEVASVVRTFQAAGLCVSREKLRELASRRQQRGITLSRQLTETTIGPLVALGVPVVVDVTDPDLRQRLAAILAPLLDSAEQTRNGECHALVDIRVDGGVVVNGEAAMWSVSINGRRSLSFASSEATIRHVIASINSTPVDYRKDVVVFHASAAEFESGVVLFPGVSNAGKSTLITQLVHRGHKYLSDEAVAVSATGLKALPFPKSITIDPGGQDYLAPLIGVESSNATVDIDPRQIGPGRISTGGAVNAIVFPEYRTCSPTVLQPLDSFDAFVRLLKNSFRFDVAGQVAFDAVASLANNVSAFALNHSGDLAHLELIETLAKVDEAVC